MPTIELPAALRGHAGGKAKLSLEAKTVHEALLTLTKRHPALATVLFNGTALKRTIGVFVDDEDVRTELDRELKPNDVVVLIAAMAGG